MHQIYPNLRDRYRFVILISIQSLVLGLFWTCIPMGERHLWYFLSLPPAAVLVGFIGYVIAFQSYIDFELSTSLSLSVLMTFATHALNYAFMDLGNLIIDYYKLPIRSGTDVFYKYWKMEEDFFVIRLMISLIFGAVPTFIMFLASTLYVQRTTTGIGDEDPLKRYAYKYKTRWGN